MARQEGNVGKHHGMRAFLIVLVIILIAVFCVSAYMVLSDVIRSKQDADAFNDLSSIRKEALGHNKDGEHSQSGSEHPDASDDPIQILPQYQELYERNPDLIGWILIDGTVVDYPVMYSEKEPEFYLRRNFDRNYSYSGVPFVDSTCIRDSNYYLIHGHNMNNGSMFGTLSNYLDPAYREKYSIIQFDSLYEERWYQVIAVFLSRAYDPEEIGAFRYYAYTDLRTKERFDEFMRRVKQESVYNSGLDVTFGDELIALSTCNYHVEEGRLVIVAKRVR